MTVEYEGVAMTEDDDGLMTRILATFGFWGVFQGVPVKQISRAHWERDPLDGDGNCGSLSIEWSE